MSREIKHGHPSVLWMGNAAGQKMRNNHLFFQRLFCMLTSDEAEADKEIAERKVLGPFDNTEDLYA